MTIVVGVHGVSGRLRKIQGLSDIDRLLISRSTVRSRDSPPNNQGLMAFAVSPFLVGMIKL